MLAVDLAEVGDEKGVLVAGVAHFMVDSLHTLVEGVANHLLAAKSAMVLVGAYKMGFFYNNMIVIDIRDELFDNSRCHHHIPSFSVGWSLV
jgi:hypothetical protein